MVGIYPKVPQAGEVPPVGPGVPPGGSRESVGADGLSPMAEDGGSSSRREPALLLPSRSRVAVSPRMAPPFDSVGLGVGAVGLPPVPAVLPGPAQVSPLGGDLATPGGAPSMPVPDLVARVRCLSVCAPLDSAGRMPVDYHPPDGGGLPSVSAGEVTPVPLRWTRVGSRSSLGWWRNRYRCAWNIIACYHSRMTGMPCSGVTVLGGQVRFPSPPASGYVT